MLPLVSVLMPVRNEARFIGPSVEAVVAQDYPSDRVEIIVADGMSTDGTREVLARIEAAQPRVHMIDNRDRIVSTGLNRALAMARGEVVVRIDGHSIVAPDFIRQNVELLAEHPEAWSVGGPIRHTAATDFGKAVAVAMSHPVGIGNAFHHYVDYEGYSDSTAFPAVRRWVFDKIGNFDVRLVRNQDDEFNYRITRAGGKIFVSPRVRYTYFVRERARQLFKQYFQYGFWRIPVIQKHRRPTTLRQIAPPLFYATCALLAALSAWLREPWIGGALPAAYTTALVAGAVSALPDKGLRVAMRVPVAIATIHAGYAFGLGYGLWARCFRPTAWDIHGQLATISR
jgi:succinoglycan biosynthesis protein ExoA